MAFAVMHPHIHGWAKNSKSGNEAVGQMIESRFLAFREAGKRKSPVSISRRTGETPITPRLGFIRCEVSHLESFTAMRVQQHGRAGATLADNSVNSCQCQLKFFRLWG